MLGLKNKLVLLIKAMPFVRVLQPLFHQHYRVAKCKMALGELVCNIPICLCTHLIHVYFYYFTMSISSVSYMFVFNPFTLYIHVALMNVETV